MLPNVLLNCLLGQYPTGLLYGVLERYKTSFPRERLITISDDLCLTRRFGWSRFFRTKHRGCGPISESWRTERATDD